MGWDAYSVTAINDCIVHELLKHNPKFSRYRKAFKAISRQVKSVAKGVDALLQDGGLDCSDCAYMLQIATNESVWTERPWTVDEVQAINKHANWDFGFAPEDAWAYYSAKSFLSTCAELQLGIKFSF